MTVRYSIALDKVAEVFEKYSHDGDLSSYVQTATAEIFKAVTAHYTAPDLIAKRPQVSQDINTALGAKLAKYGAQVINIDMTNFAFSDSYMTAINDKVTQEQKRLAAENKLHTVESEQKQQVAIAEATARALKAKADGEAYATVTAATAEAKSVELKGRAKAIAMQVQAEALARNAVLVELTKAEKWDGKLPVNIYAGAPIPFLNVK
jgi:prohibitin 2